MKKYLSICILLTLTSIGLQSCLFSEEDVFDESSANRATADVAKCQEILKEASNGWKLEYYVGSDYSSGAITFLMKFDGTQVQIACEGGTDDYVPGEKKTSLYQVKTEQSTMLTFDTYNPLLHSFSAPLGFNMNLEGDYEFIILEASPEKIILQGKKYKNIMEMTPMPEDEPWSTYLKNVIQVEKDAFLNTYSLQKNGETLKVFKRAPGTLSIFDVYNIDAGEASESLAYIYTDKGFKLRAPYIINNISIQHFTWNTLTRKFTCTDEGATDVTLNEFYPEEYYQYKDFIGDYILGFNSYMTGSGYTEATITPLVEGETYKLSLPLTYFQINIEVILKYDKGSGQIILDSQDLGLNPQFQYYFAIAAGTEGYAHPEISIISKLRNGLISKVESTEPFGFYLVDKITQTNSALMVWAYSSDKYSESTMAGYIEYFRYLMMKKKTEEEQ